MSEPSRARRVALTLAEISLWITGSVLVLLVAAFLVLGSGWGTSVVQRILALVSAGFLGRIEVTSARVFPDGTVIATGARIVDPEGRIIIAVDQATAHADLWRLIHKELHLTFATAVGVKASFAVDENGQLDIARTFQPRHPQPPSPPDAAGGGGFAVVIDRFAVETQRVALTIAPSNKPLAELLDAKVSGRLELTPAGDVILEPELTGGKLRGPLAGELAVEGHLRLAAPKLTATATATLGDSSLQASGEIDLDKLSGVVDLPSVILGPRTLSEWLAPQKPRGARAAAHAQLNHGTVQLDALSLRPLEGSGEINATGKFDPSSGNGEARVLGRQVNARALFGSLPTSDMSFDLTAAFTAILNEARATTAHFHMDAWRWDGQLVGPGQLDAETSGKTLHVTHLDLAVPGARVIGEGQVSQRRVKGRVNVQARNLGQLRSAVESIARINLPDFDGDASIQASVDGPFNDLALHADLRSDRATLNGLRSHDLVAQVEAPRIGPRMDLQAHVLLGELEVADETFSKLDLTLGWKTPELSLVAKVTNRDQPIALWARLIVPAGFERADVEELELSLPGNEWRLQLPAHLEFTNGVSFKNFRLVSGAQQLLLSLDAPPDQLQLDAEVQNLDLARIPFLALRGRKATGFVTAAVQYREGHHHRTAQGQVEMSAIAIDRIKIPAASLNGALNDSQLVASLDATIGSGKAHLRFQGPLPLEAGSLNGQLEVAGLNAADFATFLPELKPFSGSLTVNLALGGSWALPRLQLSASAEQLKGPWIDKPPTGLGPLSIQVQVSTLEGLSKVQGTVIDELKPAADLVDLSGTFGVGSRLLGSLLRKPGQIPDNIGGAPLQLEIKTAAVPLLAVGRIVPKLSTFRGTAQLQANLNGAPRAPRGSLQVALQDFGFPHRHLGTIHLNAQAQASGLTARADITPPVQDGGQLEHPLTAEATPAATPVASAAVLERPVAPAAVPAHSWPGGQTPAATVVASWGLRPEDLGNVGLRNNAPLRADVQATDLSLALVLGKRSDLKGLAKVNAEMRGSLSAPSVKAQVALTALQIVDKPAGELAASGEWDGHKLMAKLTGSQPAGGSIKLQAELPITPAGVGTGPLTGHLEATSFDLSTFEPVLVQTRTLRALGGILNADLTLGGTRAAPEPNGTLSLSQGELALAGLGELQHILLSLHVDPGSLVIDKLVANSGGGPLTARLTATRSGKQDFTLSGHLDTKRFGIYVDDQLRALLTSASDLSGKITFPGPGADVTVSVRSASVQIPTLTQRDLAPTTLDPEIHILSWRGTTESPDEANEAKEAEAAPREPRQPIYLRISAPGPIEVTGPDAQLTAKANLAVRITSEIDLTGLVAVEKGEVNALGRTFKIYRTNVAFGDDHGDFAPPTDARLDVQAGQEIDGYRITMVVLGRLDHPVPQLSSDPPLPQAQISQMLASGSSEGGSSQVGGNSLASNLLVEGMKTWLKINPPVDVLTVDPNRLEAGKRITPQLYVGVTDNYAAVNDPRVNGTEVHARYDLGHHFALDGRYGTSQAGSFDLQWRHNW